MNPFEERVKEHNADAETDKVREDIKVSLTDKEYDELKYHAYKAGFTNVGDLLSSFVGDLTGWYHTNGSDEREKADDWYNRAFGCWIYYFRIFLHKNHYDLDTIKDMIEDEDFFNDVYEEYKEEFEYEEGELQSKEDCLKVIREIVEAGKEL